MTGKVNQTKSFISFILKFDHLNRKRDKNTKTPTVKHAGSESDDPAPISLEAAFNNFGEDVIKSRKEQLRREHEMSYSEFREI